MGACRMILFAVCNLLFAVFTKAQLPDSLHKPLRVAVFAPVYLDSVFEGPIYKLGKNNLPRYVLPGLDFYNGAMMAVDSLNKEHAAIEVSFYDTKNTTVSIPDLITSGELQDVSLVIASFTTRAEIKPLADFALEKRVPLISATYPNEGGITGNPYFVLLNPTLLAHLDALYSYIHRFYPTDNIVLFRRQVYTGEVIQSVFEEKNKQTPGIPLKIKMVELPDDFTAGQVLSHLDSSRAQNIVICGSINEPFGLRLSKTLSSNKSYRAIAIGMPTWDALKDISKGLEIVYSTPVNFSRADKLSIRLANKYTARFAARPTDMFFKGYESMYHFTKLLMKYGDSLVNHLSSKEYKLFNDFDIRPGKAGKENTQPDYLENKKFYFIRKQDGMIKSVN
jgi:ABC-type branched-subunit amino acid transport system substrate-binding protein